MEWRENVGNVYDLLLPGIRMLSRKYGMEIGMEPDWLLDEVRVFTEHGSVVVWRSGMDGWEEKWRSRVEELARLNVAEPLGAPEDEIEVTPEMIEAGVAILYGYETDTVGEEYWAETIYKAMRKVALAAQRFDRKES